MLTSRSRSTEVGPDAGARSTALPRRVPGASYADPDAVAAAAAVLETSASLRTVVPAHPTQPSRAAHEAPVADAPEIDVSDLPDISGLLARLVEERIPMALMIDLVNPNGPGPDVDGPRRDVE